MSVKTEIEGCRPVAGAQPVQTIAPVYYDGRWRVIDAAAQALGPNDSGLADVSVEMRFGYLVLRAPGMLRLDIPLDVVEDDPSVLETIELDGEPVQVADEGAWAAEWFSRVLGRQVRLVKICDDVA